MSLEFIYGSDWSSKPIKYFDEKSLDLRDENAELHEQLRDIAAQNFDNLITEYEGVLTTIEHKQNLLNSLMDKAELQGQFISTQYYSALMQQEQKKLSQLQDKRKELNAELNTLVDNKEIEKYSEKWYELKGEIEGTDEAIYEANNSLLEFANTMRSLEWEHFDYIEERVSRVAEEVGFLAELIGDENLFDPDTGAATDRSDALFGLYGQNYTAYMQQAQQYGQALKKLNADIAKDPDNQLLIERYEALQDAQRDAIRSAQDERDAMLNLASEGYQAQIDAVTKLTSARMDALNVEKDLYDYQKSVAEQTKNIASLQKQLAVYEQQGTEESRKKTQELRTQLEEAQTQLRETEYDRYISDQQKLFDDLLTEWQDWVDDRLANSDALFNDLIIDTNANAGKIQDTLNSTAAQYGVEISTAIRDIWSSDNPVSAFNGQFTEHSASVLTILDSIRQQIHAAATKADSEASGTGSTIDKNNDSIGVGDPSKPKPTPSPTPTDPPATTPTTYGKGVVTAPAGLNLRAAANTSSSILGAYGQGTSVTVLERVNNGWYKVQTSDGKTGYMSSSWLNVTKMGGSGSIIGTGYVSAPAGLRLRDGAGFNSNILDLYNYGTGVSVLDESGEWYKVKVDDGREGWMYKDWIQIAKKGSYAKGGVIGSMLGATGEDGFILARSGEAVLSEDQIKLLRDTVSSISLSPSPLLNTLQNLNALSGSRVGDLSIQIEHMELPNVQNPQEFAAGLRDALKNDLATQRAIQSITVDRLTGKNSLSVRKY